MPASEAKAQRESFQPENMNKVLPGSDFWSLLTGQICVLTKYELSLIMTETGQIKELPSELHWYAGEKNIDDEQIWGVTIRELLHNSITGLVDGIRIIALTPQAMIDAKKRLTNNPNAVNLPDGLGMLINHAKMKGVKVAERDDKGFVSKVESVEIEGHILLIEEDKLQSPLDLINLCDQIDAVDPEAGVGKELALNLLAKLAIAALNAKNWQEVLTGYQLPQQEGEKISTETQQSLEEIKTRILFNTNQILETTLGLAQRVINDPNASAADLSELELISHRLAVLDQSKYREATQEKIRKRLDSLVPRLVRRWKKISHPISERRNENLWQQFNSFLKRLFKGQNTREPISKEADLSRLNKLISLGIDEAMQINALLTDRLSEYGPKDWLINTLVERGQRALLQKMPVTEAMKRLFFLRNSQEMPETATIEDYLESLADAPVINSLKEGRARLAVAEQIVLQTPEQQAEYQRVQQLIANEIDLIADSLSKPKNSYVFPDHPLENDQNWRRLTEIITTVEDNQVKDKLQAEYQAKRKIVLAQKIITDLLLTTIVGVFIPDVGIIGGVKGENPNSKYNMDSVIETAPSIQAVVQENNCAGRTILIASMFKKLSVFLDEEMRIAQSDNHTFLGSVDLFNVRRRIDGAGFPSSSYFENNRSNKLISEVFGGKTVIDWVDFRKNFLFNLVFNFNTRQNKGLQLDSSILMLQHGYQDSTAWNLFSNATLFQDSNLDGFLAMAHTVELSTFSANFFRIFFNSEVMINVFNSISQNPQSELLPWIKKSLLVVKQFWQNPASRTAMEDNLREKLRISKEDTEKMSKVISVVDEIIDLLFSYLENIPLPPGWSGDPATWSQEDIWNPELFPKPFLDDNGDLQWQMPQ